MGSGFCNRFYYQIVDQNLTEINGGAVEFAQGDEISIFLQYMLT